MYTSALTQAKEKPNLRYLWKSNTLVIYQFGLNCHCPQGVGLVVVANFTATLTGFVQRPLVDFFSLYSCRRRLERREESSRLALLLTECSCSLRGGTKHFSEGGDHSPISNSGTSCKSHAFEDNCKRFIWAYRAATTHTCLTKAKRISRRSQ